LSKLSCVFEQEDTEEFDIVIKASQNNINYIYKQPSEIKTLTDNLRDKKKIENSELLTQGFCLVYSDINKIKFQHKIFTFFIKFHENTIKRIENKSMKVSKAFDTVKVQKKELGVNFKEHLGKFDEILRGINTSEDNKDYLLGQIDTSYNEFIKLYKLQEKKLDSFNKTFGEFRKTNEVKLINFNPEQGVLSLMHKVNVIYERLRDNPLDIINNLNKAISDEERNYIKKIIQANSTKINTLINDNEDKMKKDLINKLGEINLYQKNIDIKLGNCLLPKEIKNNFKDIVNEIKKRRIFDMVYKKIYDFLNTKFLVLEEKRRQE
jgi:hypothetical protein